MNIKIERIEKGLDVRIIGFQCEDPIQWEQELEEALFWEDMYFTSFGNEWRYIEDLNHNVVYMVDGYHHSCLEELRKTGHTVIRKSPYTYEEYLEEETH